MNAIAVVLCVVLGSAWPVGAATVLVAVNGVDGAACGTKAAPCRSIGEAIDRAAPGDTISVGPGRYGDLDNDGTLAGPGEETGSAAVGPGIFILKRLTVLSRDGAGETVLDFGNATTLMQDVSGVSIAASGTVFGKPKKGFTITGVGSEAAGVRILGTAVGVHVAGNRVIDVGGTAFAVDGAEHVVEGNRAFGNSVGFQIAGVGHTIRGNLSVRNGSGFSVDGTNHLLQQNSASANGVGINVQGSTHRIVENVVTGSTFEGFFVNADGSTIMKNSALANARGMLIEGVDAGTVTVTQNNLIGNQACGIETNLISGGTVLAPQNFWGAASGPGPDPADDECGVIANPFATKEIKVRAKLKPAD